jgi:uncharacterized protein (DUF58 family)
LKNLQEILQIEQFKGLEFIASQVVEGFVTGLHKSPFHGFSVEFAEHRLYNSGESTRHIDWKLFARSEKLFVKKFEEETNLRSHIIIDVSSSMMFPYKEKRSVNKLAYSVYCAAALIYMLRKQRDAVGLGLFSDEIKLLTESRLSAIHSKMLFAELEKLFAGEYSELNKKTKASSVLHLLAESIHKRSLVIIFSDFIGTDPDELFSALQHLRYNKHEVILFHVSDHKFELNFSFDNRPYRFIDLETGDEVKFNPGEIKNDYVQKMKELFTTLKVKTGQYGIDLITADISGDFREVLLPYLIKRGKLY